MTYTNPSQEPPKLYTDLKPGAAPSDGLLRDDVVDHISLRTRLVTDRKRWPRFGDHEPIDIPLCLRDYVRALITCAEQHPQGVRILEATLDLVLLSHLESPAHLTRVERTEIHRIRNKNRRRQLMDLRAQSLSYVLKDDYLYLLDPDPSQASS